MEAIGCLCLSFQPKYFVYLCFEGVNFKIMYYHEFVFLRTRSVNFHSNLATEILLNAAFQCLQ